MIIIINFYYSTQVNQFPSILQNCCQSPTKDSFDWTLQQIHNSIQSTIPNDAIDVAVLKERSYTKQYTLPLNSNNFIQKKKIESIPPSQGNFPSVYYFFL